MNLKQIYKYMVIPQRSDVVYNYNYRQLGNPIHPVSRNHEMMQLKYSVMLTL